MISQATPTLQKPCGSWRLQNHGVFKEMFSSRQKQRGVPKMYWLSKSSWIFASSWLPIDLIRSTTEVDNQLQSQNPQRKWENGRHRWISLIQTKFTYLNTSQIYHDQRCLDNQGCTVPSSVILVCGLLTAYAKVLKGTEDNSKPSKWLS